MRHVSKFVLMLFWALWFGGLLTLMLGVMAIFKEFVPDRLTAGRATAAFFRAWGFYELAVAAGALIGAAAARLLAPSRMGTVLFAMLAVAAVLAVATTGVVMPRLETLRVAGEQQTAAFKQLHGIANTLFLARTLVLLGAIFPLNVALYPGQYRDVSKSLSN